MIFVPDIRRCFKTLPILIAVLIVASQSLVICQQLQPTIQSLNAPVQPLQSVPTVNQNGAFASQPVATIPIGPLPVLTSPQQTGNQYNDEVCGINMKDFRHDFRIVGGRAAEPLEIPFIAHLRESQLFRVLGYNKCGGVLINHSWVLTAAHCKPAFFSTLEIILGKYKTFEDAPPPEGSAMARIMQSSRDFFARSTGQSGSKQSDLKDTSQNELDTSGNWKKNGRRQPVVQVMADTVIVHPDYDSKTLENDLALIKLKTPVPYRDDIRPICLPHFKEDFTGMDGYATGWGLTDFDKRQLPDTLQVVKLPIISNKRCRSMYKRGGHEKIITDMDLCAGYAKGGMDACEGDSGGPLITQRRGERRWVLAGIVSNGVKCGEPFLPGVYTKVAEFLPWIYEQIRIHS